MGSPPRAPDARGEPSAGPDVDDDHLVMFYEDDESVIASVTRSFLAALANGKACVALLTPEHAAQLDERLVAAGIDIASAPYHCLDAQDTLATFMVDDRPDPDRFRYVVGGVMTGMARGGRPVSCYGEMVGLLWAQGNVAAALRLEDMWNELAKTRNFDLLCGYSTSTVAVDERQPILHRHMAEYVPPHGLA